MLEVGLELDRGGAWVGARTRREYGAGFGDADSVGVGMVLGDGSNDESIDGSRAFLELMGGVGGGSWGWM